MNDSPREYRTELKEITWLSPKTFEARFSRPDGFSFSPGQRLRFVETVETRDYTIISASSDPLIRLCVRHVEKGRFSDRLSKSAPGSEFVFTGPHGYFGYAPSDRKKVFVATGTGIAPFVAFVRNGATGFILLHGISSPSEMYYHEELSMASSDYISCISSNEAAPEKANHLFQGRVTSYVERSLPVDDYDFYLCGNGNMIADMTYLIDERFPGARVFSEMFSG